MEPIHPDLPVPIVTNRLHLRELRLGDWTTINAAAIESYAELHRWMPWAKEPPSMAGTEAFVRESIAAHVTGKYFALMMWDREQTRYIGSIGLHTVNQSPREFEIGYWIRTPEAGRGYMTEATIALTTIAFDTAKADRIRIRCDHRNAASGRVAEKVGYQLEGVMRHDAFDNDGKLCATRIYSRIRD